MEKRPQNDADDAASLAWPQVRFAFPGPTLLLSFTTTIPTCPTATMLCFYDDVLSCQLLRVLLLLVAALVTVVIAVSCR